MNILLACGDEVPTGREAQGIAFCEMHGFQKVIHRPVMPRYVQIEVPPLIYDQVEVPPLDSPENLY